MVALKALLPRSLLSRVMLLYMAALTLLVALALGIFLAYEFNSSLEEAESDSQAMLAILAPAVADSAVIGDYDTIKRTLDNAIGHPLFERAAFIDIKGGRIEVVRQDHPSPTPPAWLVQRVAGELPATNAMISVGGRDYGITRLTVWSERIAADLWQGMRLALAFAIDGFRLERSHCGCTDVAKRDQRDQREGDPARLRESENEEGDCLAADAEQQRATFAKPSR